MRALLDANVYISFLLTRSSTTPPRVVVEAALDGAYELLTIAGVVYEVRRKTAAKPYLASRISQTEVEQVVRDLLVIAESIPELDEPFPEVGSDRKDDYLFAHALVGRADFLISGDLGVQGIGQFGKVQILSPVEFLHVLSRSGRLPGEPP